MAKKDAEAKPAEALALDPQTQKMVDLIDAAAHALGVPGDDPSRIPELRSKSHAAIYDTVVSSIRSWLVMPSNERQDEVDQLVASKLLALGNAYTNSQTMKAAKK